MQIDREEVVIGRYVVWLKGMRLSRTCTITTILIIMIWCDDDDYADNDDDDENASVADNNDIQLKWKTRLERHTSVTDSAIHVWNNKLTKCRNLFIFLHSRVHTRAEPVKDEGKKYIFSLNGISTTCTLLCHHCTRHCISSQLYESKLIELKNSQLYELDVPNTAELRVMCVKYPKYSRYGE